jgi:hypothetical protein
MKAVAHARTSMSGIVKQRVAFDQRFRSRRLSLVPRASPA